MGVDLAEHIAFVVESMKPVAERIDLAGPGQPPPRAGRVAIRHAGG